MNTETIKETIKETTQNTEEEKKVKTPEEKKKASEEKKKKSEEKKKKFTDAYEKLESEKKQLKEENIKLKDELLNLNDAYESQLESIKEELRQEKERHQVHKKLLADKICQCDDLSDKLVNQNRIHRKKKEVVIEYIETIEIRYEIEENTFIGYGPPDAKSYCNHMKIKDVSGVLDIGIAYSHNSIYMKELLTESPQDEKWIIKKRAISKPRISICDPSIRCSANTWSGGEGCRCFCPGHIERINHLGEKVRVCKTHESAIKKAIDKFENWDEKWGSVVGWWNDDGWRERHDAYAHKKHNWSASYIKRREEGEFNNKKR